MNVRAVAGKLFSVMRHPFVAGEAYHKGFNRELFNLAVRIKIKDPQYPRFLSSNPFKKDDIAESRSQVKVAIAKALLARPDLKGQIPTVGSIQIDKLEIADYEDYVPVISAFYLGSARVDINYRLTSGYFRTL